MTDYIDRQAAIDALEERLQANGHSNVALVSELNRSIGCLMQLPSAEVEPVKRGKRKVYYHGEATFSYLCGVCGMPIDHNDAYCRWCGAKLEGAEE